MRSRIVRSRVAHVALQPVHSRLGIAQQACALRIVCWACPAAPPPFALPTWQGWLGMRFAHRPVLGVYVASQPAHARLGIGEGVPTDGCSLAMPRVTPTSSLCICARQWIWQVT